MRTRTGKYSRVASYALSLALLWVSVAQSESSHPFVAPDFDVPKKLETDQYRLRMLTVNDVVKDYDAVISSAAHLKTVWPGSTWPSGLTLEQNLIDLGWHQKEFQRRRSFAYTVVETDESRVIGCVYIDPTRKAEYDAVVFLWTRPPDQTDIIDEDRLRVAVRQWLDDAWPFENAVFPGTDISWEDWEALAEVKR
ncbi:MAG: GNAT family N-acetyltransferase [Gammaproteobacteria bacterium]